MSATTAFARIVAIVEAAMPRVQGLALNDRFVHDVKGGELVARGAPGRRFWLQAMEGGGVAPSSSFSRRRRVTAQIVVEYPHQVQQPQEQDRAILEDYDVLNAVLFDGTKWERATSSIVAISADGQDLVGPYAIERATTGWRLRIAFVLEYEAAAGAVGEGAIWFGSSSLAIDTEAEVKTLTRAVANAHVPFSVVVGVGETFWYVAPASFGDASFIVSGFIGGVDLVASVVVDGATCNVYRSTNTGLGALVVEVARV